MKFSMQLPTDRVEETAQFCTQEAISEMARGVEAAGFNACYVTEHPFPDKHWLDKGGHHALDPIVSLSAAAMATQRLKLHSNILVLPYRNPFLTAKAIASLDVLSGGRTIMGVAAGYLESEYRALGADYENRNFRFDEALQAIKLAWTGEAVNFDGQGFSARNNVMRPTPVQQPHPPIWVGGNSNLAIRRAVKHGDAWSPFPMDAPKAQQHLGAITSIEDLGKRIEYLKAQCEANNRADPPEICFIPFNHGMNSQQELVAEELLQQVHQFQNLGVDHLAIGVHAQSRQHFGEWVEQFGKEIISQL